MCVCVRVPMYLKTSTVLGSHTIPQMALNFNCPFPYSFPHLPLLFPFSPDSPIQVTPVPVCP